MHQLLFSAINGYGYYYLKSFMEEGSPEKFSIAGIVDPEAERSALYPWILEQRIPVYPEIEPFFNSGRRADLTVISSPLQYHVPQALSALKNGSNVLVDKPVGVTPGEVEALIKAQSESGRWVEVGYQWSFSDAIQQLKADLLTGRYGAPLRMKSICLWPRGHDYYHRNRWAGRIRDDQGELVYDSPANNACAHFLHNMFFLLGDRMNGSSLPVEIDGELHRAYDIENFDTISCRMMTSGGTELMFFASHVTAQTVNPCFELETEMAIIRLDTENQAIEAYDDNKLICSYGHPDSSPQFRKLFRSLESLRNPRPTICPPEAALSQTLCIDALQKLPEGIKRFGEHEIVHEPDRVWVKGLGEKLLQQYHKP